MITQELLDYIAVQKRSGAEDQAIRQTLITSGWSAEDVDTALGSLTAVGTTPDPVAAMPVAMSQEEAVAAVKQMGKFKASWRLFKQSFHLLCQDKEVLLFPILSTLTLCFITVMLYLAFIENSLVSNIEIKEGSAVSQDMIVYGALFIYYIFSYFIATYFKVGLTAIVYARINGNDLSFGQGISQANGIAGKIFVWSLIASTVGIILQIISDKFKSIGRIAANLLGAGWSIVTLFIAPTLLLDNVSVWKSIGRSAEVFKKTWGETLILNVSFGLITFFAIIIDLVIFGLLYFVAVMVGFGSAVLIAISLLSILSLIMLLIISTSISEIFKVTLYSYARFGIIAEGFSPELIVGSIKKK